jgi:broad-specificity NMP kinase
LKNIIFINGTMGVGKTATSRELQKLLPKCVFLDGDWCWDMNPFKITIETKKMVEDNIRHILNNFIKCTEFENIIFCWVMHEEYIIESILSGLNLQDAVLYKISLICSEQSLVERLSKDVDNGIRIRDVIARSVSRLKNYTLMDTIKIDVSKINAVQASQEIISYIVGVYET